VQFLVRDFDSIGQSQWNSLVSRVTGIQAWQDTMLFFIASSKCLMPSARQESAELACRSRCRWCHPFDSEHGRTWFIAVDTRPTELRQVACSGNPLVLSIQMTRCMFRKPKHSQHFRHFGILDATSLIWTANVFLPYCTNLPATL
jgi:hypothetical protein